MNSTYPPHTNNTSSFFQPDTVSRGILSAVTWIVALIFTIFTLCLQLVVNIVKNTLRYALRWSVYLLLISLFLCGAFILVTLSIITLGAISLP